MSYVTERYDIVCNQNHGINVVQCGWQKCDPGHHLGPMFYQHYSITFVLAGCGYYTAAGSTYKVQAGEGFVIVPGVSTYYIADTKEPWEYRYAIFQGSDALLLLNAAGLGPNQLHFSSQTDEDMGTWLRLLCQASASGAARGYDVQGYFFLCMSRLVQQHRRVQTAFATCEQFVSQALAYMKMNYAYNISIQDVAAYVGIERSYLYRLFKHAFGCSPQAWLIQYRLKQGAHMLVQTDRSVAEIACSIGFFDAPHFSRSFRKRYSQSPLAYRKNHLTSEEWDAADFQRCARIDTMQLF